VLTITPWNKLIALREKNAAKVAFFFFSSKYSLQNLRADLRDCLIKPFRWQAKGAFCDASHRSAENDRLTVRRIQLLRRNRHTALWSFAAAKPSFAPTKLSFVPGKPLFGGSKP